MESQVERQRRDNQRAGGCEEGEWVSPSALGVRSEIFLNFYIKIVSFRAFCVAKS